MANVQGSRRKVGAPREVHAPGNSNKEHECPRPLMLRKDPRRSHLQREGGDHQSQSMHMHAVRPRARNMLISKFSAVSWYFQVAGKPNHKTRGVRPPNACGAMKAPPTHECGHLAISLSEDRGTRDAGQGQRPSPPPDGEGQGHPHATGKNASLDKPINHRMTGA